MKVLLFAWALVMVGCCVEQPNEMSCSITCDDPAYPIPGRVERPEGPFFTCADSELTCDQVPGAVCDGGGPGITCVSDDGTRSPCEETPRCGWSESCSICCPDDFRIPCAPGICGESIAACEPYGLCE